MANISVNLDGMLHQILQEFSQQTGVPKNSLILYAISKHLAVETPFVVSYKFPTQVRSDLRVPDEVKERLEKYCRVSQISMVSAVNNILFRFLTSNDLQWFYSNSEYNSEIFDKLKLYFYALISKKVEFKQEL